MSSKIIIGLQNILYNYRTIVKLFSEESIPPKICVSVKANAYGHGISEVVHFLHEHEQIDYWGIASIEEARLIHSYIANNNTSHKQERGNILCYTQLVDPKELREALSLGIELFVGDFAYLQQIQKASELLRIQARIHLMIETGMGRTGFLPKESATAFDIANQSSNLLLVGICTHFSDSANDTVCAQQVAVFETVCSSLSLPKDILRHCANSGAILWQRPHATFDLVRPGIMLYGSSPSPKRTLPENISLKPCMKFIGTIASIHRYSAGQPISYMSRYVCEKDCNIAVVNTGYGDGLLRSLSNKGVVSINKKRYSIVGNVCMDMCMVLLGDDTATIGSEACFFGDDIISIDEQAGHADSISYVLSTQTTSRPERKFIY